MNLLDQLAADAATVLSGQLRPAELKRDVLAPGTDGAGNPVIISTLSFPCEGVRASYDAEYAGQSGIPREHARIELLAASLPPGVAPERLDTIVIEGEAWRIVEIERDAANVLYVCQCAQVLASV